MADPPTAQEGFIALDVGGTAMKGALFDRERCPVSMLRRPTPRRQGPEAVVDAIAGVLGELAARARSHGFESAAACAVVPVIEDVFFMPIGTRISVPAGGRRRAVALPATGDVAEDVCHRFRNSVTVERLNAPRPH
ncbi:hypothetical protein OH805_38015 [Streptomyces sp. NBC_00879]|uniref:hypothetical protein n=1 Tax=Streptomyces sp. NBC_00879 TaxID=2975855 RepID=UPI00386BCC3B|nr:hypothetical protein OH805_38015 [Streptomyces sp. NBC_00879]